MTDDEISEYESRLNQREVDRKEAEIKKLEERLSKLKAE
jgi:polyhydroxyalkanoate synthesis regulator phasin